MVLTLSLGGDSVGNGYGYFQPLNVASWVSNARFFPKYHSGVQFGRVNIDYEHFNSDLNTIFESIGQLIRTLKQNGVIAFASIAPFDEVQSHYMALWKNYGHLIDYVNFQFYAYHKGTSVSQFIDYFNTHSSNYEGGNVLASFISDGSGGLAPVQDGFFTACNWLKSQQKLNGIFIWSADDSKARGFPYERQS